MTLEGRITRTSELNRQVRDEMFTILERYFDGYERENFESDLDEKDGVLLLEDDALRGFSTFRFLEADVHGQHVRGVFSGDTIVEEAYRGQQSLSNTWSTYMLEESRRSPVPFYWFLISSGYKTYRFLPVFLNEFFPRYDRETPPFEQAVLEAFATMRFANTYDPRRGTIRFEHSQERLKPGVADITDARISNPHIRFFLERNPGHGRGDELACIAKISTENFKPSVLRRIGIRYEP